MFSRRTQAQIDSPTPHGVGGLKYQRVIAGFKCSLWSHPSRGGWIEIIERVENPSDETVPPLTGWVD